MTTKTHCSKMYAAMEFEFVEINGLAGKIYEASLLFFTVDETNTL